MRIALVGADCEENLGLGMIAASLLDAGHEVAVVPFNTPRDLAHVVEAVLRANPDVVGLGMQFQFRSREFAALAQRLRCHGYRGHVTAGGQHASLACAELLASVPALDSIVLFEGETTIVELVAALAAGTFLGSVAGLALRGGELSESRALPRCLDVVRTASRPLHADLDALPFAHRYRPPTRHLGMPFIPMSGSRGCWRSCAFCSITSYYRAARKGGGRLVRVRSVRSLADEMAALHRAAGSETSLFCFHDDSFLLPRGEDTVARLRALREALRERDVHRYGLIGKCRPDTVTVELARELEALGVVRMFVGVENASQAGLDHLDRRATTTDLDRALLAFRSAGIFATYNLLLFEPDATLDDVRQNAAFLRRHAGAAGNFCRAEPFHGTPMQRRLAERGALFGDHHGWDYRIADDRVELLFRLTLAAFRERNYGTEGVGNRHVGLAYMARLLRTFVDSDSSRAQRALARAEEVVVAVSQDSADGLEWATDMVERLDPTDHEAAERAAVELSQRVAARDRELIRSIDAAMDEINAVVEATRLPRPTARTGRRCQVGMVSKRPELVQRVALAGALLATAACGGKTEGGDRGAVGGEGVAPAGGTGARAGGTSGTGAYIAGDGGFPPSGGGTAGTGGYLVGDGGFPPMGARPPTGGLSSDGGFPPIGASPPTGGYLEGTGGVPTGGWVSDTGGSPPVGGMEDTGGAGGVVAGGGASGALSGAGNGGVNTGGAAGVEAGGGETSGASGAGPLSSRSGSGVDHWRDTTPVSLARDIAVALHSPPAVTLEGWIEGERIRVVARGVTPDMELYWSGGGARDGKGAELLWTPTGGRDRLGLVVRHRGGVASLSLTAADANGA